MAYDGEMTYEQRIAKTAGYLVKVTHTQNENYRKYLDRFAANIADEYDMDFKDVRHEIHALVNELA